MTYRIINTICVQCDVALSAAEIHGVATGLLCLNEHMESDRWLSEVFGHARPLSEADEQLLIRLYEETARLLASDQFEFELFLPDDNTMLTEQVAALISWCQGFLYGVGSASAESDWTGDAGEIIKDITEFTKLDVAAEGEDDEAAFMEITEYLKSAVLLLRDELNASGTRVIH